MSVTVRQFRWDLYEEHLESASFLQQQRSSARAARDFAWLHVAAIEERLEAHLAALLLGGELAAAVCAERSPGGDAGQIYAAACVCCRGGRWAQLVELAEAVDPEDEDGAEALAEACRLELPAEWMLDALELARSDAAHWLCCVAAASWAHATVEVHELLVERLAAASEMEQLHGLRALSRGKVAAARPLLESLVTEGRSSNVRAAAAEALLTTVGREAAARLFTLVPEEVSLAIPLGHVADGRSAQHLRELAAAEARCLATTIHECLATPADIEALLRLLPEDDAGPRAARALHTITGAGTRIAREHARTELLEFDPGWLPVAASAWTDWWARHRNEYAAGQRYRLGQPAEPQWIPRDLLRPEWSTASRDLLLQEAALRHSLDLGLDPFAPVHRQLRLLHSLVQEAEAAAPLR